MLDDVAAEASGLVVKLAVCAKQRQTLKRQRDEKYGVRDQEVRGFPRVEERPDSFTYRSNRAGQKDADRGKQCLEIGLPPMSDGMAPVRLATAALLGNQE